MTSSQQSKDSTPLIHPDSMDLQSIVAGISTGHLDNTLIDLSALSLIRVDGDDAQSFLQGQFSNDLNALDRRCQLHAYCNPKGRCLAIIRIVRNNQGKDSRFWMIVPRDMRDSLISRLKMFVMRAKVTLQPDTEHVLLGAIGKTNEMFAEFSYRVNSIIPRQLIIAESRTTADYLETSDTRYHCDFWRWLDIRSGIPQIYAKTSGEFIPQTINLELVDGISFKKGCFPGQEIVARIKYLGKPKQRLIIAEVESDNDISPGDEIYSPIKSEQKSGMVVDAVKTGEGHASNQWQLSAMIPATMVEAGDVMLGSVSGAKLRRIALPYPVI